MTDRPTVETHPYLLAAALPLAILSIVVSIAILVVELVILTMLQRTHVGVVPPASGIPKHQSIMQKVRNLAPSLVPPPPPTQTMPLEPPLLPASNLEVYPSKIHNFAAFDGPGPLRLPE